LSNHPQIQFQIHQLNASRYGVAAEKAKMLPEVSLGLSNQSIIGYQRVGDEDRYFDGKHRFTYLSAGLSVPLFAKAQKARIAAAEIQVQQQQKELEWLQQRFSTEQLAARLEAEKYRESLQYYQQQALPNARAIVATASRQYAEGEINYLEWVMLVNQSFDLQSQYLDQQLAYNEAMLLFRSFSNQ
jgi:cobalt-zinc-cadmium resistance protein CzcA